MNKGTHERISLELKRAYLLAERLDKEQKLLDVKTTIMAHCLNRDPDNYIDYYRENFQELSRGLVERYLDPILEQLAVVEGQLNRLTIKVGRRK